LLRHLAGHCWPAHAFKDRDEWLNCSTMTARGELITISDSPAVAIERVGIIGAGTAAAVHLRALQRLPGKRVVGILDIHPGRAAALADKFALPRSMTDPNRLYEEVRPQLVHVVTPPNAHQDIALEALARGVHVLVEKPPALTVAGCRLLLEQAKRGAVTIGVNENTALDPLVLRADPQSC
jgi:predicted dehydrogenase